MELSLFLNKESEFWQVLAMDCEICGREIYGRGRDVVIDGAKLLACFDCAKSYVSTPQPPKQQITTSKKTYSPPKIPPLPPRQTPRREPVIRGDLELVEDYRSVIRKARESMGLTHDALSRKVGERISVLQKLESGKMIPDQALTRKLEHALKVELLQLPPKVSPGEFKGKHLEPTLGDIVSIQRKNER